MAEPTIFPWVRKGLRFEDRDGKSLLVAAARQDALPLPKTIRLGRLPGPLCADADPRIWQLWGIQKAFGHEFPSTLRPDEIQRFTVPPSQIVFMTLIFDFDGHEVATLGGHYALHDGGQSIEFAFDRSFVQGLGLHRLSIAYRLYASAVSAVLGGRSRRYTPTFCKIPASDAVSRRSYLGAGGCEIGGVPECLVTSEGNLPRPQPVGVTASEGRQAMRYVLFPPSAMLAAYDSMLSTVEAGRWETSLGPVPLDLDLGELGQQAIARRLRPEVEAMCRLQAGHLARYQRYRHAVRRPTA